MEERILELFLFNNKLKFCEIEDALKVRSNKLAYHLKKLLSKGIIEKSKESYSLSDSAEYLIPYLSKKKAPLPVVLIHIGNKNSCFLYLRKKRPYRGYLSLPGGRIQLGENIEDAVKRIMNDKHKINADLKDIHSLSIEHIFSGKRFVHSFLLIFVSAITKDNIEVIDLKKNKKKIIKSDYSLIKNHLGKKIQIEKINSII